MLYAAMYAVGRARQWQTLRPRRLPRFKKECHALRFPARLRPPCLFESFPTLAEQDTGLPLARKYLCAQPSYAFYGGFVCGQVDGRQHSARPQEAVCRAWRAYRAFRPSRRHCGGGMPRARFGQPSLWPFRRKGDSHLFQRGCRPGAERWTYRCRMGRFHSFWRKCQCFPHAHASVQRPQARRLCHDVFHSCVDCQISLWIISCH